MPSDETKSRIAPSDLDSIGSLMFLYRPIVMELTCWPAPCILVRCVVASHIYLLDEVGANVVKLETSRIEMHRTRMIGPGSL